MNPVAIIRVLVVYLVCLPLAIYCGFLLASPESRESVLFIGALLFLLITPLLLKWYHPLLLFSWNLGAVVFFLPGQPRLWLVMTGICLGIAVFQRSLNRGMKFLPAWSVALPLIFIALVVVVTAQLTGGIGLRAAGSGTYGGKRYFVLLGALLGFFAFISKGIPPERRWRYAAFFFLSGVAASISSLITLVNSSLYVIFLVFPPDAAGLQAVFNSNPMNDNAITRLGGAASGAASVIFFMLCVWGIRGLFGLRNFWKLLLMVGLLGVTLAGGFRSIILTLGLTFAAVFYFEGLVRSRYFLLLLLVVFLGGTSLALYSDRLPSSAQRALCFLPIKVDPVVAMDAQDSSDWRVRMWKLVLPDVPRYLWLGKGYNISGEELEFIEAEARRGGDTAEVAMLAGDYHNGPLSVIIPFGIWGALGFVWFVAAAIRALYRNYKYSDPALKTINTFLLATLVTRVVVFFAVVGAMDNALVELVGIAGFSISLNGGIRGPHSATEPDDVARPQPRSLAG